jgi:drug/metabolite transporter (DMT)-like permease
LPSDTHPAEQATPVAAILLILGSGLLFSFLDAGAKWLVLSGMSAPFVVWMRFAVHVVLVLILFQGWRNRELYRVNSLPLQLLRGVFLFGSTIFNFLALLTLQLAEGMAIYFLAPMVITALAGPLLGEWAGWRRWAAIGVAFIGMLVVTRPGFGAFGIGHLYALLSVLSYALYVIMTRQMGTRESSASLIFYSALAPVIFMSPALPLAGSIPPDLLHWVVLLSLGFFGGLGHWLIIKAYKRASVSSLAPYPYLQLVWAVIWGYVVFDDLPDRYTLAGAAIIVASGGYIVHRERQLRLASTAVANADARDLAKKL